MDKTLEIIMVAMTLLVAAVVVISLLQGQSDTFGEESETQTTGASCSLGQVQAEQACGSDQRVEEIKNNYEGSCDWADDSVSDICD